MKKQVPTSIELKPFEFSTDARGREKQTKFAQLVEQEKQAIKE